MQEFEGPTITRSQLKKMVNIALSFHYLANEEQIVSQLLETGKKLLKDEQWSEAIEMLEEVENIDKWSDMHATEIYSSLSAAHANLGNLQKSKHYL